MCALDSTVWQRLSARIVVRGSMQFIHLETIGSVLQDAYFKTSALGSILILAKV
jgi:hypothetical protein